MILAGVELNSLGATYTYNMSTNPQSTQSYDAVIAVVVIALFAFLAWALVDNPSDEELHRLDDDRQERMERAGFDFDEDLEETDFDSYSDPYYENERDLDEAYEQGRSDAAADFDNELRSLQERLDALELQRRY